jgi:preprotein translocase subunit YajC
VTYQEALSISLSMNVFLLLLLAFVIFLFVTFVLHPQRALNFQKLLQRVTDEPEIKPRSRRPA